MSYQFTSESVSEGHPDKIADQISDALLDNLLAFDPDSRVACETLVTTGQVVLAGEITSETYIDAPSIAREVIKNIGYTKSEYKFSSESCGVISLLHEQSPDINQGVDRGSKEEQGAGDQGMMFGYATNETDSYMPLALVISHRILQELAAMRRENDAIQYLRPDSKSQVTIEYSEEGIPLRIETIVISTQHDPFMEDDDAMLAQIKNDLVHKLMPRVIGGLRPDVQELFSDSIDYKINPTGKFVIGGPHGDAGLTGRKIIVDTYGGKGAHGGGAFSGKDPSKVDRSAAYAARHIAKNLVAAGVSPEILVQVSYAIGVADPTSIMVNTYGKSNLDITDSELGKRVATLFPMRPADIEARLKLRNPIYSSTAKYGHFGKEPETVQITFQSRYKDPVTREVELYTWEKLDHVDAVKKEFNL